MRIAVTTDPELPVPPTHYGGIERVVAMLVDGLVARGHDVTLVANADSRVAGRVVPYPACTSRGLASTLKNMRAVAGAVNRERVDIVHSFGRLAYLLPLLPTQVPKVMSYQRVITPRSIRLAALLGGRSVHFTGCSRKLIDPVSHLGSWHVVYNGVQVERYGFQPKVAPDAPLMFLGRVEHIKGPHVAIEVAKAAGRRLVIAGNVPREAAHEQYFREKIQPHVDGEDVVYVGPVDDRQKSELLGQSAALLMPILWEEPFGIVMAEALACGTPVVGFGRGSVREVVEDGATGYVCDTAGQVAAAVGRLGAINRMKCREAAERRFSASAIVDAYESVYRQAMARVTGAGN